MSDYVWILSTESSTSIFNKYGESAPGAPKPVEMRVVIHGGANIGSIRRPFGDAAQTDEGIPFYTPRGIVTRVERAKYEHFLMHNDCFQTGVKGGFYKVLEKDPGENHAEVKRIVNDTMTAADNSAPLTAARVKSLGKLKVRTTNTSEES